MTVQRIMSGFFAQAIRQKEDKSALEMARQNS